MSPDTSHSDLCQIVCSSNFGMVFSSMMSVIEFITAIMIKIFDLDLSTASCIRVKLVYIPWYKCFLYERNGYLNYGTTDMSPDTSHSDLCQIVCSSNFGMVFSSMMSVIEFITANMIQIFDLDLSTASCIRVKLVYIPWYKCFLYERNGRS